LASTRASEIFETNIHNEVKSLKDAVQKIEERIGSPANLPQEAVVGVEIEKLKDLMGELNLREKKIEEIMLQSPSKGSAISKASRTRNSRALHRKT